MFEDLNLIILSIFFNLMVYISMINAILFLPLYPLILRMLKNSKFKLIEKVAITIISNMALYIVSGIIGYYTNFLLTSLYFFLVMTISFLTVLGIIIIIDLKSPSPILFNRSPKSSLREIKIELNPLKILKSLLKSNSFYFILFVFLTCILDLVRVEIFVGTDGWMHISIIKYITVTHKLPITDYFGAHGIHVFGAVIQYFSGVDIVLIPRYFIFYTFPVSALVAYVLFKRIFRRKNIALFGVYILIFSSLGFSNMMYQFWPSSIVLIQGILIFFLLYTRIQDFVKEAAPSLKQVLGNIGIIYPIILLNFLSALFSHSLIAMILLVSFLWVYLVYFIINYRRGFDFLLLCLCLLMFFILYIQGISTGHFIVFNSFSTIPIQYIVILIGGAGIFLGCILYFLRKNVGFTKGTYKQIIQGEKFKFLKTIEEKYLVPGIFTLSIVAILLFGIMNTLLFNFNVLDLIYGFELIILILFGIWGIISFQFKTRGKPLWFWGIGLVSLLIAAVAFDVIFGTFSFASRVLYLSSPIFAIGFSAYIYKLIKTRKIKLLKNKLMLTLIIALSLIITYTDEGYAVDIWSLDKPDINLINTYSKDGTTSNVVIAEFGWAPVFIYYGYQNANIQINESIPVLNTHRTVNDSYLKPSLHIQDGINILTNLKKTFNASVYLIVSKHYYNAFSSSFFSDLSDEEVEAYYHLNYLNRIFSSKSYSGEDIPLYWVI
ncbi:MAG: hypothetical protein ACTSV5_13620 [Promethearchaeota archaeon]